MNNYHRNKRLAVFHNTEPTATDQSGAEDTDINVIVGRMGISNTVPANQAQPMYQDWTQLPDDLRSMIETSRTIAATRRKLPKELAELPIEQLLSLTAEQLTTILTPPEPKPPEEKK